MKRKLLAIVLCFLNTFLLAQVLPENPICIPFEDAEWSEERQLIANSGSTASVNEFKLVRINFHIVSRSDSTGHFTETDDHLGNNYSGYDLVYKVMNYMTTRLKNNQRMNLPPNNTTPNPPKNWYFIVDAIYFIHDDNYFLFPSINSTNLTTVGHRTDSVLNIFLTEGPASYGGYAVNINPNSKIKYTENRNFYTKYATWLPSNPTEWRDDSYAAQLNHELTHLLGLSHTVMYNNGTPCPVGNNINLNCDDGCTDTPTAWDMYNITNQHPTCGWGSLWDPNCTSNMMDYTGGNSLTPCQLNIIHTNLDNGLKSYRVCEAVSNDISLCELKYPQVSYYGKKVTIGDCNNTVKIESQHKKDIYFSEEVTIQNFEVKTDSEFEVFFWDSCP